MPLPRTQTDAELAPLLGHGLRAASELTGNSCNGLPAGELAQPLELAPRRGLDRSLRWL